MQHTLESLNALLEEVTAGNFEPYGDGVTDDEESLYGLIDEHGEDPIKAAIKFLDQDSRSLDIASLEKVFGRCEAYKGEFRPFGEFVKAERRLYVESNPGAARLHDDLVDYVDWEAYADTPEWSDFTAIRKFGDDDTETTVYVFEAF